jgi:hypothetical protein
MIFRGGRRGGHEKSREGPEHENQWQMNRFPKLFEKQKPKKCSTIYQDQIFLDETGWDLNEKMMPDATAMVPDLEIGKIVSKIDVVGRNMW